MAKDKCSRLFEIREKEILEELNKRIRESVKEVMEAILEEEAKELLQAERYERSELRRDYRNGKRKRKIQTRVGEIELMVPRLRVIPFQSAIIERYRRMEISLEEALLEMYLQGVSTRRVSDITEALCGVSFSPSRQSRINKKVYEKLSLWLCRGLKRYYPYLYLDGIIVPVRIGDERENVSLLVAVGVTERGEREVVGVSEGIKEDGASWKEFLVRLKERGLEKVDLVIADAHLGIREAISEVFPEAAYQRCLVHLFRNILSKLPRRAQSEVLTAVKTIYSQESEEEARKKAAVIIERYEKKFPQMVRVLMRGLEDTLTFYRYPQKHWRMIRTNNSLERLLLEVRRRMKVVPVFPDVQSALYLAAARLKWVEEKRWNRRRYLDMEALTSKPSEEIVG